MKFHFKRFPFGHWARHRDRGGPPSDDEQENLLTPQSSIRSTFKKGGHITGRRHTRGRMKKSNRSPNSASSASLIPNSMPYCSPESYSTPSCSSKSTSTASPSPESYHSRSPSPQHPLHLPPNTPGLPPPRPYSTSVNFSQPFRDEPQASSKPRSAPPAKTRPSLSKGVRRPPVRTQTTYQQGPDARTTQHLISFHDHLGYPPPPGDALISIKNFRRHFLCDGDEDFDLHMYRPSTLHPHTGFVHKAKHMFGGRGLK